MDIFNGKSGDNYHGFPIEEERPEANTSKRGAPSTTFIKVGAPKIEMSGESKKVSKKSIPV